MCAVKKQETKRQENVECVSETNYNYKIHIDRKNGRLIMKQKIWHDTNMILTINIGGNLSRDSFLKYLPAARAALIESCNDVWHI